MAETVVARNEEQGGITRKFQRSTFDRVWSTRGWELVTPLVEVVVGTVGDGVPDDPTDLTKLTRAQLVEVGVSLGLTLRESDGKDNLIAAIEAKTGEES